MARHIVLAAIALSFAIISSLPTGTTFAGADAPLTSGEWIDFALRKLEVNGLTGPMFSSSKPLRRDEIAGIIAGMREKIENGLLDPCPYEMELIQRLEKEFAHDLKPADLRVRGSLAAEAGYRDEWNSPSVSLWGAASFQPLPDVILYEEIDIRENREIVGNEGATASKRLKRWKWDYTADFQRAYVSLRQTDFETLLGRQSLFWGPGYGGSLMLSDNSPAFDMVLLSARFAHVKAIAFSAVLDKMWSEHGNPPYRYLASRFLSGHRIDWIVSDRLELGLSELVLYGGEVRSLELSYMNPLLPYYATQWNSDLDDNVLVSADFAVRPIDKLKIYGQFLVDDFSYSGDDPNSLGYIAGFYMSDPLGLLRTDLRAEYARIDTYTYAHRIIENQFTHYGWVIGHHLGPDADQLLVEMSRMIVNVDTRLKVTYAYERHGGRTLVHNLSDDDYKSVEFPSEPVERQHGIGLQLLWEPLHGPQVNLSWQRLFHSLSFGERDSSSCETAQKDELRIIAGCLFDSHSLMEGWKRLWGSLEGSSPKD